MKTIKIATQETTQSEIYIENDLMDKLCDFFEDKNYYLITNDTIAKLYPQILYKFNTEKIIIIKDGEKYKDFKTYNYIMQKLLDNKIERKDCIVALGGGVVGDIAGFCASTILRGVELIQIPTTLLAMCDSSIGGKTGYNTRNGKNLIGTFYKAKKILIDPMFLNTLDKYQINCGLGEVIKYAFIEKSCKHKVDFNLIEFLTRNQKEDILKEMNEIIYMCASLKSNVVELDEKEGNLRKVLNLGHTFAHPIETLTNYKKISHGQAVAHGIKIASKLAYNEQKINKEYFEKINFLINKFELTNKKIHFNKKKFIRLMYQDKKVENKKINLLLPTGHAQVEIFDNISVPSLEACLP